MRKPGVLVMGAGSEVLDLDAGQLCSDHAGEIDRSRSPAGLDRVFGEPLGHFGSDLEAARPDVWSDDGSTHLPTFEPGTESGDDAGGGPSPPGVCHADGVIGDHHDSYTIRSEHRQRESWDFGEQCVGRAVAPGRLHVDDAGTVNLVDDRPPIGDAEPDTQTVSGLEVGAEVAVGRLAEHDETVGLHP